MRPVEEMVLFRFGYHRRFQERVFRRDLECLGRGESWTKLSIDGETNVPTVWPLLSGEVESRLGKPEPERGEALGLSNVDDDACIVGRAAAGRARVGAMNEYKSKP